MSTAQIRAYLASIASVGGKSTSAAKKKAARLNAFKATAAANKARAKKKGKL